MADIADVLDVLEALAVAAVYPGGIDQPSVSGKRIDVGQGWPPANLVESALKAGTSLVSIYAVPSTTSKLPVPLDTSLEDPTITAPVHGMTASITGTGLTLAGDPGPGEYATVIMHGKAYSAAAAAGDTVQGVAATLAASIAADRPGTAAVGTTITIPGLVGLTVRIGAPGTLGHIIDRQRQNIMVSVWAPNPSDRAVIGRALDVAVKRNLTVAMPDTTQAIMVTQTTSLIDKYQDVSAYCRDLTVQVQWDTLDTYPAYEVTSVIVTTDPAPAPSLTTAI